MVLEREKSAFRHRHAVPLQRHLAVVSQLSQLTKGYTATYQLQGRALRVVSECEDAPDVSTTRQLVGSDRLEILQARGGHFEFFRLDAEAVAKAIAKFLGLPH